jgi:hypothetical protein
MNQHQQQCDKPIVAPATQKNNAKEQHKQCKKKCKGATQVNKHTRKIQKIVINRKRVFILVGIA